MQKILLTDRLVIRPVVQNDALLFHENLGLDPEMIRFTNWNPYETLESTCEKIAFDVEHAREDGFYSWAIELDGALVGTIGAYDFDANSRSIEIGYSVFKSAWGKGIASEAVCEVVRFLLDDEGMSQLKAWTHEENVASSKVLEKAGFRRDGYDEFSFENSDGSRAGIVKYVAVR